jgi:hypothetical protein
MAECRQHDIFGVATDREKENGPLENGEGEGPFPLCA